MEGDLGGAGGGLEREPVVTKNGAGDSEITDAAKVKPSSSPEEKPIW
jgi:hypothetical protein